MNNLWHYQRFHLIIVRYILPGPLLYLAIA